MKKLILFALILLLAGCKTVKYIPVETVKTDTTYVYKQQRDSVMLHDSIYIHEYQKGDTIYIDRDRWHTQWRDHWHTDTIYKSKTDSVPVPYPVEVIKEVDKPLTWWQRTRMHGGDVLLALLGIAGIYCVWRIRKNML